MQNILIVEDDDFLRKMCAKHLKRPGRTVRTASDGGEGIEAIKKEEPDLLLLDLLMPHVDGFTVLDFIKAQNYTFPVIILSNITWNFDAKGCKKIGATDYYIKSNIDITTLIEKIDQYLPQREEAKVA